ncbi:MAG: EI24 domain-containing protein [Sneathiella sp.]|nr:EI24 domain-containing protein [Sneathiella sp.]
MIQAIGKAIAQLSDPKFRSVILKSLLIALITLVLSFMFILQLTGLIPQSDWDWVNSIVGWLSGFGSVLIALFLFPLTMSAVIGIFLDDIADAVEAKHYPNDPKSRDIPLWSSIWDSLKFFAVIILCNLLALPLYLIPGVNLFVYYILNGYLLSREFFQQVAIRHHETNEVSKLRKIGSMEIFLTGVAIAFCMTIPVLNLIVPIIATATMVHLYKKRANTGAASTAVNVV